MKYISILDMPGKGLTVNDNVEYLVVVTKKPLILQDNNGHLYTDNMSAAKAYLAIPKVGAMETFRRFYQEEAEKHGIESFAPFEA